MLLHLFALLVAASTAVLIFAGGMVTSTGSGLAVPDWPNTYGWFMWTFPIQHWVGGIFYEHTHRLIASTVGFLILVLAVWLWRAEPRRWVGRSVSSPWQPSSRKDCSGASPFSSTCQIRSRLRTRAWRRSSSA